MSAKDDAGCLGHWSYSPDGNEYDCDYEFACNCEDCVFGACGGKYDPRYDRDHQPSEDSEQTGNNHDTEGGSK